MKILIIVTKGPARNAYSIADAGGEIGGAQMPSTGAHHHQMRRFLIWLRG